MGSIKGIIASSIDMAVLKRRSCGVSSRPAFIIVKAADFGELMRGGSAVFLVLSLEGAVCLTNRKRMRRRLASRAARATVFRSRSKQSEQYQYEML